MTLQCESAAGMQERRGHLLRHQTILDRAASDALLEVPVELVKGDVSRAADRETAAVNEAERD